MFELEFEGRPYITVDNQHPLFFIAGPCVIESRAHALEVSAALREVFTAAKIPFIYKSSFDKANRSSGSGFRGVGMAFPFSLKSAKASILPCLPTFTLRSRPLRLPKWRTISKPPLFSVARRISSWPPRPP